VLLLRPEKLRLAAAVEAADVNVFEGRVGRTVYQGESVLLLVSIPEVGEVSVRLPTRAGAHDGSIATGDAIRLALHAADTIVLEGR
jgi:putative spermidine/putrescine transport system ATP-binding protein